MKIRGKLNRFQSRIHLRIKGELKWEIRVEFANI